MTAKQTLAQFRHSHNSLKPQRGILTLFGYGIQIRVDRGHLIIEDGIGPERRQFRLPRVDNDFKRLICISEDGFATFSALKWLSDIGASLIFLDRRAKVLFVTGPTAKSDSQLIRAQALAHQNGKALEISRELIRVKLEGEERVVRKANVV